jgi:hypothetical protein
MEGRGVKLNGVRLAVDTTDGPFGFHFTFGPGLNIVRASNSSGKSTLFNCILYGLGLEELIGGKGEHALVPAVKDQLFEGQRRIDVQTSEVFLEVAHGEKVITVRRPIHDPERSWKLVEVYDGALPGRGEPASRGEPMYLFDKGSASKDQGFHRYLERFLDLDLPAVAATNGGTTRLYLQAVFAGLAVEQKRGWTDYIANIPFFGIRDAKTRVVEYLLGLTVFEREAKRAQLEAEEQSVRAEWQSQFGELTRTAAAENIVVKGVPREPVADFVVNRMQLSKHDGKTEKPLDLYMEQVRSELADAISARTLRSRPSSAAVLETLSAVDSELKTLVQHRSALAESLMMRKMSVDEYAVLLADAEEDLERNRTARKLRELGAHFNLQIADGSCPTCHQAVADSLLQEFVKGPQMEIAASIDYLESQVRMLQRQMDGARVVISESDVALREVERRIRDRHEYRQTLVKDVAAGEGESRAQMLRQVQLEAELNSLSRALLQLEAAADDLEQVAGKFRAVNAQLRAMPADVYGETDSGVVTYFEKQFRANAGSFEYESAPISDIRISRDTLRPVLSDMELKEIARGRSGDLNAASSASDFVRLIWAYLIGIYEASSFRQGNHPGLLMFDEPGQHSMASSSQHAFFRSLSGLQGLQSIVAASFDENESVFREATENLKFQLIKWDGKVIARLS